MKVIMPLVKLKVYRQWDYLRCRAKLHNMVYRRPAPIDHQIPIDISPSSSGHRFLWAVTSNLQRTTMPLPGCAVHHEGLRPCHCPCKEFRGTHCPETVVVVTVEKRCDSPFPQRQPWSSDPPVLNSDRKDVVMDASLIESCWLCCCVSLTSLIYLGGRRKPYTPPGSSNSEIHLRGELPSCNGHLHIDSNKHHHHKGPPSSLRIIKESSYFLLDQWDRYIFTSKQMFHYLSRHEICPKFYNVKFSGQNFYTVNFT